MSKAPGIANLPWYDLPELRDATDALWAAVAAELRERGVPDVPGALDRHTPYLEAWHSPRFLLGQACGYDLVVSARDHLRYLATPCYSAPCCDGPDYRSYVVVREEDPYDTLESLRGLRCVINQTTSHSGMNTLRCQLAPRSRGGHFFAEVRESGSHEQSLADLHAGRADVAAIDCVAYALWTRVRPASVEGVRVLFRTSPVPAPPYVTSIHTPPALCQELAGALVRAPDRPGMEPVRQALQLGSIRVLEADAYAVIRAQKAAADEAGYFELLSPEEL